MPLDAFPFTLTNRLSSVPSGIGFWLSPTMRMRFLPGARSATYMLFPEVLAGSPSVTDNPRAELSY